jgi:hypothetical protein
MAPKNIPRNFVRLSLPLNNFDPLNCFKAKVGKDDVHIKKSKFLIIYLYCNVLDYNSLFGLVLPTPGKSFWPDQPKNSAAGEKVPPLLKYTHRD